MRFTVLLALAALIATAAATPPPPMVDKPVWRGMRPHDRDIAQNYPEEAMRLDQDGLVTLECGLDTEGAVHDCEVVEETPEGLGFGASALKVSWMFHMASEDAPAVDSRVRVQVAFRPPPRPVSVDEDYALIDPVRLGGEPAPHGALYFGLLKSSLGPKRTFGWLLGVTDLPEGGDAPVHYVMIPVWIDCYQNRTMTGGVQVFDKAGKRFYWTAGEESYEDSEPTALTRELVDLACGKKPFEPVARGLTGVLAEAERRFGG